jgi:integrase
VTKFDPTHPVPCVYLKHGAYWLVKKGKWTRIGATLDEALAEFAKLQAQPSGEMAKLIDAVLKARAPKLAESTRAQYLIAARILKRKLVQFAPSQVKSRHVAAIVDSMQDTPNMANRVLSFLRTVFAHAVRQQLVDSNPCVGVKRLAERKRERYITDTEWLAIFEKAGPRLRVIMRVAYLTGQRIDDVLKIRRTQIGADGIEFKQKKTGAKLLVRWSPDLRSAVADALALHGPVQALTLFLGRTGKAPDYRSVLLQWHTAADAAGVADALPNDQRAKAATDTKRQGGDPTALLGHTSAAMTERYLRDRETPQVSGPSMALKTVRRV